MAAQLQDVGVGRGSVGIALSGGGHRATIFGLGALLYLVDAGLNRSVLAISSVSGGSILNGFLGLLEKSLSEFTPEEFEIHAGRLARQVAGNPKNWRLTLAFCFPILIVTTTLAFLAHSALIAACVLAVILLSGVFGARSGGTLWAWSGTWIYLSAILVALVAGLICLVHVPGFGRWVGLALFFLCGVAFTQRNAVASMAFGFSCCSLANKGRNFGADRLEDLNGGVRHIICATEMHSGQHFFFLKDLVYSPGIGVGFPGELRLRAAMQASANVPVAFPFRLIRSSRFRFGIWDQTQIPGGPTPIDTAPAEGFVNGVPRLLRLCDGGVFDNLSVSWFLRARTRFDKIESYLTFLAGSRGVVEQTYGPARERALEEKLRLGAAALSALWSPDRLIVINGGKTPVWRNRVSGWIPMIREFTEAIEVSSVMYDNTQSERLRELQVLFGRNSPPGAVVDLAEAVMSPSAEDCVDEVEKRRSAFLERHPLQWRLDLFKELDRLVEENATVPTTLRPLGRDRTAELLYHGYLQAMISLHIRLESPLLAMPDRSRFLKIANGS